ncbi:MAG: DUF3667 domain-containing protein [Flavobacterium sp.]|nr:MAG: DUF3667 domain-containing protein [Flavobacterium sp.]
MDAGCLNCGYSVADKYCGNCGQKFSTHRYSFKHFIEHDFIHGVWHVDKGVIFTVKELLTNPGHSVRRFILGKRTNFFNFVTLILLTLGISSVITHYTSIKLIDLVPEANKENLNILQEFATNYPKIILLITIPITSLSSFIWFRKAKFNYSEHLVLNSYKAAIDLLIALLFTIVSIFYTNIAGLSLLYFAGIQGMVLLYSIWMYGQFFSKSGYSKFSLLFKSIMVPVTISLFSVIIGIIWGIVTQMQH